MVHSFQCGLSLLYYFQVCIVKVNIWWQQLVGLDKHHHPEVAEGMHCYLEIGEWPEVACKMGRYSDHMEYNLERNGVSGPQEVV